MVLAAVAVAVAWILRPGGLDWAPSRSRLIIAGVFPWLLFMAISLGGLGLLMRRRQACLLPENGSAFIPHLTDINADGIAGSSANGDVRRPWSYFVSYVETDNLYLIYTKDLTVMIFPKRVLSERDDVELRSMVMSNVPIGSFRERPSAFPVAPQAAAR